MNILIVEDDENKRSQLQLFIHMMFPGAQIAIAKSLQSGLRAILDANHDLIILDMTMPTYDIGIDEDGGRTQPYAGREILRQIERRDIVIPVIVVTQFDRFGEGANALTLKELDQQLRQEHPRDYMGSVFYSAAVEEWKQALHKVMKQTIQAKGGNRC